jgi:hypothetical protein
LNFQHRATIRITAIFMLVMPGRAPPVDCRTRYPRWALNQELEAKQTFLGQLRALVTDDPDFFTGLLADQTKSMSVFILCK